MKEPGAWLGELEKSVESMLRDAGERHAEAVAQVSETIRVRDDAIRQAAGQGFGVREIARAVGMDPAQVSRIIRPR